MPAGSETLRVAIAGATSLCGKELKELLEEGGLPTEDIRLLDEELVAGTLSEAGGEPVVVQAVDEESFHRIRFAFFTGSPAFARRHWEAATRAGATVIDLSGGLSELACARRWIPSLDAVLPPPASERGAGAAAHLYIVPSAPAIVASSLAAALAAFELQRLAIVFFQPVSQRGQEGIEELESQTVKLLSFQPIGQAVFDAQVAFNLLDRFGAGSAESLSDIRRAIAREVNAYLAGRAPAPAMALIQVPVFYSHAFTAYAELARPRNPEDFVLRLEAAGFTFGTSGEPGPSNVSVAGESAPRLSPPESDPNVERGYWLWGVADNLRLVAATALQIAEKLIAS